jgi:hypothetical protein
MPDDVKLTIDLMPLLFQKSGKYLENFEFGWYIDEKLKEKLLESIKNYCKKIKYFDLNVFNIRSAFLALDSIKNLKQNLNYLCINASIHDETVNSTILTNLGQILPNRLECLHLSLSEYNDLGVFLKNSKNTFIVTLLISFERTIDRSVFLCIKKFILKEKRVKYLAIDRFTQTLQDDEEFKSYDIKIISPKKIPDYMDYMLNLINQS